MEIKYDLKENRATKRKLVLSDLNNGDIFRLVDDRPNIVRVMVCKINQRCLTLNKEYISDGCYQSWGMGEPIILLKGSFVVAEMVTEIEI